MGGLRKFWAATAIVLAGTGTAAALATPAVAVNARIARGHMRVDHLFHEGTDIGTGAVNQFAR